MPTQHQDESAAPPPNPEAEAGPRPSDPSVADPFGDRTRLLRVSRGRFLAVALVLGVAAVVLNGAIYMNAHTRLAQERWDELGARADHQRDQVRRWLLELEHRGRSIAREPEIRQGASRGIVDPGAIGPVIPVEPDLARAADAFRLRRVDLVAAGGIVSSHPVTPSRLELARGMRDEVSRRGRSVRLFADAPGSPPDVALAVAVPEAAGAEGPAFIVVHASPLELVTATPLDLGSRRARVQVSLVSGHGEIASSPSHPTWRKAGAAGAPPGSQPLAEAMRTNQSLTLVDETGRRVWAVSRTLPELGAGLVVQADEAEMLAGVSDTWWLLVAIQLAVALLAAAAVALWGWRYRGRAARAAQRHRERLRAVIDHAFDAIMTFDSAGRIRLANRAARHLLAADAQPLEGESILRFIDCGTLAEGSAFRPRQLETVERLEATRLDGGRIPVEVSLSRAGEGASQAYVAVVRDAVSQVEKEDRVSAAARRLEEANRQLEEANAQLAEASRLKSEFLANTSHELRTPLNGIIGFLQLVLDDMCDSEEEEREFLRNALQCSRHLLGLINDVLDIAKIEAGKLTVDVSSVDLGTVFADVHALTHVQAAQRGLTLTFEPIPDGLPRVRADLGKTKQVLVNLMSNSIKFTMKGGITVRASEVPDGGHVLIEVEDTGIGIPPERQKAIFDKFTQADGTSTRRYGGTGLGLAISRSLVELMGGVIGVESEGEGKGTRLFFSLPIWREEPAELPEGDDAERIEGPAGGPLILMVEDDPVFRKFLAALLQKNGYRTVEATEAERGWILARRVRPDTVILDYALTCGQAAVLRTGWDLAERMASDASTRHIPLLFVTGFDKLLNDRLKNTMLAQPPQHLMKPVDPRVLLERIEHLVGAGREGVIRVLMADDDPSVVAFVQKALPRGRFHFEVANNGEECLHILRLQPQAFDLLLLDLMMPDVNGYDVLRELSLREIAPGLPVLVLTSSPEARNAEERALLEQRCVLDVVSKTTVHETPHLLTHLIDWHLNVAQELREGGAARPRPDWDEPLREAA